MSPLPSTAYILVVVSRSTYSRRGYKGSSQVFLSIILPSLSFMWHLYHSTFTSFIFLTGPLCMLNIYNIISIFSFVTSVCVHHNIPSSFPLFFFSFTYLLRIKIPRNYLTPITPADYLCFFRDVISWFRIRLPTCVSLLGAQRRRVSGPVSLPLHASPDTESCTLTWVPGSTATRTVV